MPSFGPSPDHVELQQWLHPFAAEVIRPAAAEWDEKEEFPWPVVEEAAKVGIYSLDFFATQSFDPTGLGIPIFMEEVFWGDAGIGLSIVGTALAAAGLASNGTPEQLAEWAPEMFGEPGDLKIAAFCSSEPDAGSDAVQRADHWFVAVQEGGDDRLRPGAQDSGGVTGDAVLTGTHVGITQVGSGTEVLVAAGRENHRADFRVT